ncbi:MAG: hypothetical protein HPY79_01285 [Bacteroidales bacterium]|nr:hypothetical protein [Bacteroidales bacterium]
MKNKSRKYLLIVAATLYTTDSKQNIKHIEGKIKISNDSLFFIATSKTNRLYKLQIPIQSIFDVIKKNSLGFIPNILIFKTQQGDYKFAVYAREQVVHLVTQLQNKE